MTTMTLNLREIGKRPNGRGKTGQDRITPVEKREIAKLVVDGKESIKRVTKLTKVHKTSLRRWMDKYVEERKAMSAAPAPAATDAADPVSNGHYAVPSMTALLTPAQAKEAISLWFASRGVTVRL